MAAIGRREYRGFSAVLFVTFLILGSSRCDLYSDDPEQEGMAYACQGKIFLSLEIHQLELAKLMMSLWLGAPLNIVG